MRRGLLALALCVLVLACRPEPTRAPAPASPPPAADKTPREHPRSELPPALAEPPAPTAALPPGTPTEEGVIIPLVAIDDQRAIVGFHVPGSGPAPWWLALMRRDGSLSWVQTIAGDMGNTEGSSSIEVVGDTVSVLVAYHDDDPRLELRAFALADGKPQFTAPLGKHRPSISVSDGSLRVDVSLPFEARRGDPEAFAEVVASSATGVVWRAKVPGLSYAGPDPTFVGDAIALRGGSGTSHDATWTVLARKNGKRIGELKARVQSCSDGTRWFLINGEGLVSVDPKTLRTRLVTGPLELPGLAGPWALEDCVVADGAPVALVARDSDKALVAFDAETFAVRSHVELGPASLGYTRFDPLPAHVHSTVLAPAMTDDGGRELLLADMVGGRPLERWRGVEYLSFPGEVILWRGGYVLPTTRTVTIVDAKSGALEGRAIIPEVEAATAQQLVGDTLWLLPRILRLGTRAPYVLDLGAEVPDDVRRAAKADLRPSGEVSKAP
jgi:hypothetical protein